MWINDFNHINLNSNLHRVTLWSITWTIFGVFEKQRRRNVIVVDAAVPPRAQIPCANSIRGRLSALGGPPHPIKRLGGPSTRCRPLRPCGETSAPGPDASGPRRRAALTPRLHTSHPAGSWRARNCPTRQTINTIISDTFTRYSWLFCFIPTACSLFHTVDRIKLQFPAAHVTDGSRTLSKGAIFYKKIFLPK